MRQLIGILALLAAALVPAAADAPFAPVADVPDHVVTMVERAIHRQDDHTRIVMRHGDWTRIDKIEGAHRGTEFFAHRGAIEIRIYGSGPTIHILRGGEPSSWTDNEPRNTGKRQTLLGESCTVWEVKRLKGAGPNGLAFLSCVTDDGIELWQKAVSGDRLISSAEATRIERRAVAPDETRPPKTLIALDWWDQDEAAPARPSYETVMKLSGNSVEAGKRVRTTRQQRAWRSIEETVDGVRRIFQVAHHSARMQFHVASDEAGAPKRLVFSKSPPPSADQPPPVLSMQPKDLNRRETVLGEGCRWFDMMPGAMDAGLQACRTDDGITLKEQVSSHATSVMWTAVRLERRAVGLGEVTPPAALRDPKLWGLE